MLILLLIFRLGVVSRFLSLFDGFQNWLCGRQLVVTGRNSMFAVKMKRMSHLSKAVWMVVLFGWNGMRSRSNVWL